MEKSKAKRKNLFSSKSESLNDMIINYYNRFGKNRDLEKYLRFRSHYTGIKKHSSSESSLLSNLSNRYHYHQLSDEHEQTSSKSLGSLEQLLSVKNSSNNSSRNIATGGSGDGDSKNQSNYTCTDKKITETEDEKDEEIIAARHKIVVENLINSPPKINITNIKREIEGNNKKAYSFNCESNIEITIPSFPAQPTAVSMPNLLTANSEVVSAITEGSQTDFDEIIKCISTDKLSVLSEVNEEDIQTPKKTINNSTTKSISPDPNIKSTHKRLEWDSLGDVGYNTTDKTPTKDKRKSSSISTLEKSVLKDFFAQRGFALSFPSLALKSSNNQNERPDKSSSQGAIPKKRPIEEKWRKTLASVQQKYNSSPTLLSRQKAVYQSIDTDTSPDKTNSFLKNLSSNRQSTQIESSPIQNLEQFCQTSLVKTECREVQCDFSNGGSIKSAFEIGSMTSQSSFEYYSKTNTSDSNKENTVPPKSKTPSYSEDLRKKKLKSTSGHKESSPRKLANDINRRNEVELGIQLLCSLIEAKNLNDRQKKMLIKKIIAKIANKNIDSLNSTTTLTDNSRSYSNNSIDSKASSIITSALITSLDKKNLESTSNEEKSSLNETKQTSKENKLLDKSCITSPSLMNQWKILSDEKQPEPEENLITNQDSELNKDVGLNEGTCNPDDKEQSGTSKSKPNLIAGEEKSVKKESVRTRRTVTETSGDVSQTSPELITMREWLDPITKSEFNFEKKNKLKNANQTGKFKFFDQQKKKHFNWIEKEIKRLENLKNVLQIENESTTLTSSVKDSSNPEEESNSKMLNGEKRLYDRVASPKFSESSDIQYLSYTQNNYISPDNNYDVSTTNDIPAGNRPDSNRHPSKFSCNCNSITKRNSYLYDEVNPYHTVPKSFLRETRLPNEGSSRFRSKLETPTSSNNDNDCLLHALKKRREFIEKYVNQEQPFSRQSLASALKKKRDIIDKYLNTQEKYKPPETHYSNPKESPPIQQNTANINYPSTSYDASSPSMSIRFASGGAENCKQMRPSSSNQNSYNKHGRSQSYETSQVNSFMNSISNRKNGSTSKDRNNFIDISDLAADTRATLEYCKNNLDPTTRKKSIAYIITFKGNSENEKLIQQRKESSSNIRRTNSSPFPCSSDTGEKITTNCKTDDKNENKEYCSKSSDEDSLSQEIISSKKSMVSRQTSGGIETCCKGTQESQLCNEKSKSQSSLRKEKSKNDTSLEITTSEDDQNRTEIRPKKCVKINCECSDHEKKGRRSRSHGPIRKKSDAHITIEIITRKESSSTLKEPCKENNRAQICIEPIPPPCPQNISTGSSGINVQPIMPPCPENLTKKRSMADTCKEKSSTQITAEREVLPCEIENDTSNDCSNICPDECNEPLTPTSSEKKKKKKNGLNPKNKKCPCKDKRKCYCKEVDSKECLTLQDHYQFNCPDFYAKAMERQSKLKELQKLRKERSDKMHEIVENHSCSTIFRKLKQLPPPASTRVKIFTTKEKQAMTKRKHRNLPETVQKCEVLKRERQKCGNQILQGIFNQRMQKRVRQGKLSLQPSRTII